MKIKCGVIGLGKIGLLRIREINLNTNLELYGVYEKNYKNSEFSKINYNSVNDLLDSGIQAVFICAYNDVLAEYTKLAMKKGIHVFCEKPPARTVEELKSVLEIYEKSNCILKYGFNHRYHYSVIEAKKIIDSGKLGKLLWMRGVYGKAGSIDYDKNWRNYKNISGGGILIDQGIHMIDLIQYLSSTKFETHSSYISTMYWNIESEDNAFALLKSDNNVVASIHSSATHWKHKFLLELCFENGYLNLDGILSGTRSYAPETLKIGFREFEDITFAMGKPQEKTIWFENDDSWKLEIIEFSDAILGKSTIQNGTIYDAIEVLECITNIYNNGK